MQDRFWTTEKFSPAGGIENLVRDIGWRGPFQSRSPLQQRLGILAQFLSSMSLPRLPFQQRASPWRIGLMGSRTTYCVQSSLPSTNAILLSASPTTYDKGGLLIVPVQVVVWYVMPAPAKRWGSFSKWLFCQTGTGGAAAVLCTSVIHTLGNRSPVHPGFLTHGCLKIDPCSSISHLQHAPDTVGHIHFFGPFLKGLFVHKSQHKAGDGGQVAVKRPRGADRL